MFNKIFHKYIKRFLNLPNWSDTIQSDGYNVVINGIQIEKNQVAKDADYFLKNKTYQAILNNIKIAAENTLRDETYKTEDLYFPKATLFILSEINNQMESLAKLESVDREEEIKHNDISTLRF